MRPILSRRGIGWLRGWRAAAALAGAMAASGCAPTIEANAPSGGMATQPVATDTIGSGKVRVALLLPASAPGNAGLVAASLRHAVELALKETPGADLTIIVKDDQGTSEGGRAAAAAAVGAGAELIIGPLFAASVRGASEVARPAGVPMLVFSTDSSVAARGVYLFGFLPEGDADRIARFAAARGKRSFAALLPDTGYGSVFGSALQRAVAASGGQLAAVERYGSDAASLGQKVATVAALATAGGASAIAVPAGDDAPLRVGAALAAAPGGPSRVQLLGSGQWNDPRLLAAPALQGGWFPAPDGSGFAGFAARYAAAFGTAPPRPAALAFDATRLAAGLAARYGEKRFAFETLTNPNGFTGVDGAFRLLPDGLNQRSLAIYEVAAGSARIIDPAPRSFPPRAGL
ncbi:penicillin-binding protein activator [Mesorhizobium sp. BR1-1-16]|uniref:penicillin-binding protein activator n=1 Tax=Mesorhizobium sp. BR1-1-16 TaxID=2876653 RepID=UPI001CCE9539|nr:penicillin-binding protein activator [Mesorhizobium sp. BR1-1-16]